MTERWVPAPGYPDYEVSDLGNVRTLPVLRGLQVKKRVRIPTLQGFVMRIRLWTDDNKKKTVSLAPLILTAFGYPQPSKKHNLVHLNNDVEDCRLKNLRWMTDEDIDEMHKFLEGASDFKYVLSAEHLEEIREYLWRGYSYKTIAMMYEVSEAQIKILDPNLKIDIKRGGSYVREQRN